MTALRCNWRIWTRGLALIDMVVTIISILFGVYSLIYIKFVYLVGQTDRNSVNRENTTQDDANLKTDDGLRYDGRLTNHSKVNLLWAIFAAILAYLFILVVHVWLSFNLFRGISLDKEDSITASKSRLWRDFNFFQVGFCILFFCLDALWTPYDPKLKMLIICLVGYRLACSVVAYYFVKEITPLRVHSDPVEVVVKAGKDSKMVSNDCTVPPSSKGVIHK